MPGVTPEEVIPAELLIGGILWSAFTSTMVAGCVVRVRNHQEVGASKVDGIRISLLNEQSVSTSPMHHVARQYLTRVKNDHLSAVVYNVAVVPWNQWSSRPRVGAGRVRAANSVFSAGQ